MGEGLEPQIHHEPEEIRCEQMGQESKRLRFKEGILTLTLRLSSPPLWVQQGEPRFGGAFFVGQNDLKQSDLIRLVPKGIQQPR